MSTTSIDLLGLRKMSKGWRCIGWLIGGSAVSLFVAYALFLVLLVACGRAANIDTKGTPLQEFVARVMPVILSLIVVGGCGYSFVRAIACWREK